MSIQLTIDNKIIIPADRLPADLADQVRKDLTLLNPKWEENEKHGRWNNERKYLRYFKERNGVILAPRGYAAQLQRELNERRIPFTINDKTLSVPANIRFRGKLFPYQLNALKDALSRRFSSISVPTGGGKTVISCALMATRKERALVIVPTKVLLYQWKDRIEQFIDIQEGDIGLIGDGHKEMGALITVGIVNSLYRCADELAGLFGNIVCDEAHRTPSRTFTEVLARFNSRYCFGASATRYRRDGLTRLITFYCGEQVHHIAPQALVAINRISSSRLVPHVTEFDYPFEPDQYQAMLSTLIHDYRRNNLIVDTVVAEARESDGISLVVSDRVEHISTLHTMVQGHGVPVALLVGSMRKRERENVMKRLEEGSVKVLFATASLIGEGFDLADISQLHLASPVKYHGRVIQYAGRALRAKEGKVALIHDYIDQRIGVLRNSFKSRIYAYNQIGVEMKDIPPSCVM